MKKYTMLCNLKKQICAFMAGLLFLLSVTGITPATAESAIEDLDGKKEKAIDWVASVSGNEPAKNEWLLSNSLCNAMAVLKREGREIDSSKVSEWEQGCFELNVDEQAHLAWAYGESDDLKELWKLQNSDGGFGLTKEYSSDLYDTMLAVAAVAALQESISDNTMPLSEEQIENAVTYILSCQNEDGGFGYTDSDMSRHGISAETGIVLLELGVDNEMCYEALDTYCKGVFQTSFTEENFNEQAKVARYLYKRDMIENTENLEKQLSELQEANGSIFNNLPDTLEYILLLNEIQDYNSLKLIVHEFACESDTYVLKMGEEQTVSIQTVLKYKSNQQAEARIRYTVCEDGKTKTMQENDCLLLKDETQCDDKCELVVIPEEGHEYTVCVELLMETQEKPYAQYKIAYNLQKSEYQELVLEAEYRESESSEIFLSWNDISSDDERYAYRLFRRKGENEWETRSAWDGTEKVKVLNVYPNGYNYLYTWMNTTVSGEGECAGKGLIDVKPVAFSEYNAGADKILRDENGNYKYDVIMIGSADCNGGWDLSETAWQETQRFVDSGRGILFGHDTVVSNKDQVHPNLARFGEQLGITFHRSGSAIGGRTVEVIREGFLTNYPWKISGKLTIPYAHSSGQFVEGELGKDTKEWIRFEGIQADDDAYLISRNQLAMIQTGHSNGQATDDERKILANTLFYLKQMTNQTSATDKSVSDEENPVITSVATVSDNDTVVITAEDHGSEYQYYVEAIGESEESKVRQSNVITAEVATGVKGFILRVNDEETLLGNLAEYDEEGTLVSEITEAVEGQLFYDISGLNPGECAWLHICAVDYAGNVSDEFVQKIEITPVEENDETEKAYFNLPYALYASEGEVQLFCCEANINGDVYGKNMFRFQGSTIHLNGRAVSPGTLSVAGGILDIKERAEYAQEEVLPDYMSCIIKDMGETDILESISAYNSTDIFVPTRCKTTTGAWCNDVKLYSSLVSEDMISFNANTIMCGEAEPIVLASESGNIHMQATKITGNGIIYAPNGTVTINVSQFDYTGTIVAKEIKIQVGYYNQNQ